MHKYNAIRGHLKSILEPFKTVQICKCEVVHKNNAIRGHLKSIHNLRLDEYRTKYIDVQPEVEYFNPGAYNLPPPRFKYL